MRAGLKETTEVERERKSERRAREKGGERMTKRERGALKLLSATHRVFYCFPRL